MQQKNGSALGRTVCIDASPPGLLSGADTDSALRRYEIVCGEANANGNNKQYKYNNAANNDNQAGNHANKGTKNGYRQNGSIHVQNLSLIHISSATSAKIEPVCKPLKS